MATIKDVARLADVSVSTVSKYINGGSVRQENALSIRQAIETLGFHVNPFARGLKTQTNRSIGILLPDMTAPFYGAVTTTIDRILRENGYHTLFSCYGANHGLERENLQFLLSTGISGLIYVPEDLSADEFHELTSNLGIPTVQMDRIIQGVDTDAVLSDNVDAAYQGVTRLIQRGHTRIAAITGPKSVFSSKERLVGYLRALSDNNILYDDELVIKVFNQNNTYHDVEQEIAQSRQAFILGVPTAISFGIVSVKGTEPEGLPVGDRYGAMYELVDAETVSQCIARTPGHLENYAHIMADLARGIHETEVGEDDGFPEGSGRLLEYIDGGIGRVRVSKERRSV